MPVLCFFVLYISILDHLLQLRILSDLISEFLYTQSELLYNNS